MRRSLVFLLLLSSCALSSVEDFRKEGALKAQALTEELRQIQTRSELQAAAPRLRRRFCEFADLLLEAREFLSSQPNASPLFPTAEGDELFAELSRLYELPEGRELMESIQLDALKKIL